MPFLLEYFRIAVPSLRCTIKRLQRNKAAGPDELPPALFKDGCATLTAATTQLDELIQI